MPSIFKIIKNIIKKIGYTNRLSNDNYGVRADLLLISQKLLKDWTKNTHKDKVTTESKYDGTIFKYKFENGDRLTVNNRYGNKTLDYHSNGKIYKYQVGSSDIWVTLIKICNLIVTTCNDGTTNKRSGRTTNPNSDHPKWDRYWNLVLNIRQRTTNLKEISDTDPNRAQLINELNSAKRRGKAMKEKYNF